MKALCLSYMSLHLHNPIIPLGPHLYLAQSFLGDLDTCLSPGLFKPPKKLKLLTVFSPNKDN